MACRAICYACLLAMLVSMALAQDCSGQGVTWGPGIGPPPDGCGSADGPTGTGPPASSGPAPSSTGSSDTSTVSVTYNTATGKFSGTIGTASIPSVTGPAAAPGLGNVGYATNGNNIYGPFEAGFGSTPDGSVTENTRPPHPCYDGTKYFGYCPGGMDVGTCEHSLFKQCGDANVLTSLFMDACGGHATPYHYHTDIVCNYDVNAAGHSGLVGIMLDGVGLYGKNENGGTKPTNLDACGGHTGPVPANSTFAGGISASTVYHYHIQTEPPFLNGCFGPVNSITECKALYTSSDSGNRGGCDGMKSVDMGNGQTETYDLWCPCYESTAAAPTPTTAAPTTAAPTTAAPTPTMTTAAPTPTTAAPTTAAPTTAAPTPTTTTKAPTTDTTTKAVPTKTWDASIEINGVSIGHFSGLTQFIAGSFEKVVANVFEISEKDVTDVEAKEIVACGYEGGTPSGKGVLVTFKVAVPDEKNATETLEKFENNTGELKTALDAQGWSSDSGDIRWYMCEATISGEDVATTTKAPTTTTTAPTDPPTVAVICMLYPSACEAKSKSGEICYEKFITARSVFEDDNADTMALLPAFCENVGSECIEALVKTGFSFPLNPPESMADEAATNSKELFSTAEIRADMMNSANACKHAASGDSTCMVFPATCEVKDSAGTFCVTKFVEYGQKLQGQPTCETIEAAGVTKECLPLLVDSKLNFKDIEGKPLIPESDQGIMVAVLSACATGAPIPDIPDDKLTPIDASVVLTGMTKDQFDAEKFAIATAKTMDINEEDITDVKVEEVAASSKRRSLTATNLKVTFKVAVKDTIEAKEVRDKLEAAIKDGNKTYETNLKAAGITGFTGIEEPKVVIDQAPAEATPTPAAPTTTTTKAPTTTTTKAPTTTTTKAPVQTATTKAPVKTVTTAPAKTSGAYVPSFFVGVAGLAFAAMSA